MDSSVGDYDILETSTQNNNRNVQEKESTNVSQSEQKIGDIWTIECLLKSILTIEDLIIQQMAHNMKAKFDPFYVKKVKQIKINLYKLYDEYVNKDDQSNKSHSQVQASSSLGGGK
ncbi:unnamed protein product [Lupinus luteus]|uniref:Uncharacterized protein n=1 Tax=Lupinus luteus TaxID=3873 RepID=A0AAV1Y0S5_LUPLU